MSAESKPMMSWEEEDVAQANDDDFLGEVEAMEVPMACSISDPTCEACQ